MKKYIIAFFVLVFLPVAGIAQGVEDSSVTPEGYTPSTWTAAPRGTHEHPIFYLTLQDCRDSALHQNKQTAINRENIAAAKDLRAAAVAKYFPTISANGLYQWNERNLFLLPDQAELTIGTVNTVDHTFTPKQTDFTQWFAQNFPEAQQRVSDWVVDEYTQAREMSELDIHHIFVGQVGVTQPIFTGGKITELYRIAKATEQIAEIKAQQDNEELMVSVDEAYWRVISVEQKYLLADKYCRMLRKVVGDLENAVAEGTMTQADVLKVRVKLNEAEVSLAKAENGLRLSKMALCQLMGLPLDSDIRLDNSGLDEVSLVDIAAPNMEQVWSNRQEIQMLEQANKIAHSGMMLTASGLMPTVVAQASYVTTNPNLFNGYRNNRHFDGMFTAGVVVNVPIAHADDILQVRAAKHKARTTQLQLEEAKEKIALQATQTVQQLSEANRKLVMATANIENAEENLRMAQAAFDEGMLTSTELLGAQTAWLKAYSEKIDAAIEVRMYETYLHKNLGNY